ncbi:MAG: 3-deoxy-7-phosphoheptulonate synthase [Clostridia bacterium]|nr:3-deoxy-7-phosphoheptulonate synthase [Clostridia bacterium]
MIIVLKKDRDESQYKHLLEWIKSLGLKTDISEGENSLVMGLVGDTSRVDIDLVRSLDIVEDVKRIQEPFKMANRKFHPEDTVVKIGDVEIGGGTFAYIAGPCSVESEAQIIEVAAAVKAAGAKILRGGAFKPRTSPYAFQGLRDEGIRLLLRAKEETGLPIVTEIMSEVHIDLFRDLDIVQIGARDMQNFELLKAVGKMGKPVVLKRGIAATVQEWLMSAEYLMSEGCHDVILCERGIRTYETSTRNTLDISAVPVLKELTHLPVIVDPSHASGVARYVKPLSKAAAAAGADGVMIEVHNDPPRALCDGAQSLRPEQFRDVVTEVNEVLKAVGKRV